MARRIFNILFADDRKFFKDALDDLHLPASLGMVNDGVRLMKLLARQTDFLPGMIFLDLNMPRKTGFECLTGIKSDEKLGQLTVLIYSTFIDSKIVDLLFENMANYYIPKPGDFEKLKDAILATLKIVSENGLQRPAKEKFIISLKTIKWDQLGRT